LYENTIVIKSPGSAAVAKHGHDLIPEEHLF